MSELTDYLERFGNEMIPKFQAISKGFAPSLGYEIVENGSVTTFRIAGDQYILTLIYGRGPTSSGAKKGNPSLHEKIYSWVQKHGIASKINLDKPISEVALAWAITKKIHKEGTLLYREIQQGKQPIHIFNNLIENENMIEKVTEKVTEISFNLVSFKIDEKL